MSTASVSIMGIYGAKKSPVLMIEIVKDGWLLYVYTCNAPKEKKQIDS